MTRHSPSYTQEQRYNVLDCCSTLELRDVLVEHLDNLRASTYLLSRSLQAPILSMTLRGVRINTELLPEEKEALREKISHTHFQLKFIVGALSPNQDFNPGSWQQLRVFLFDTLKAEPIWTKKKGEAVISTDREALEEMSEKDEWLTPFIDLILLWRDQTTLLKFLNYGIDSDGRIRSFFSIAGTVTGRLSSSENAFGRGGNLQNITEELRHLFIADPGYLLLNIDLSQADSWNVGMDTFSATGDSAYLDAIQSGDLHTTVTRLVWPELPWTGDLHADRSVAERPFYRHHEYRFMSKKAGHGSNYLGTPWALAHQMRISKTMAKDFQDSYFSAFPAIRDWQQIRIGEVQTDATLISLMFRKRRFHGRRSDRKTWKDAIAFLGQSPTADIINTVTLRLHRLCPEAELLLQVHDSLLLQIPIPLANTLIPRILELFRVPITVTSPQGVTKTFAIPSEAAVGWNWGKRWKKLKDGTKIEVQADGLEDWRGALDRQRRYDPSAPLLDRVLS